ncbi:hypothetical protein SAMN05192568_10194 [Methylobacterium pseudosasicola]|uniref:Uncharacterized protein n=1 Tax=Methylobacterium pseudosasicola TaxID=582667 RepID=A0A1I4N0G2_9HYPH|nr:hypothetical protein SAMN05192568_10194 [Methylobacterium pseudosasicola]
MNFMSENDAKKVCDLSSNVVIRDPKFGFEIT